MLWLNPWTCTPPPTQLLQNPQIVTAIATIFGVAISGLITLFVTRRTLQVTERNAKLSILDRQYEALIVLMSYNETTIRNMDDLRSNCLPILTLLAPNIASHRALQEHIEIALLQQPDTDWGFQFVRLSQQALADSVAGKL